MKKTCIKQIIIFLRKVDLAHYIAKNLLGEKASSRHRKLSGIAIMIVGVGIIQLTALCNLHFIQFVGEVVGNGLHGIGLIPFVEVIERFAE